MDNINEKTSSDTQSINSIMDAFSSPLESDEASSVDTDPDSLNLSALRKMEESDEGEPEDEEKDAAEGESEADDKESESETEQKDPEKEVEEVEDVESKTDEEVKVLEEPGEQKFKNKEIKFKVGDKESTVPNNAIIEILVDGGIKKLHLQEVINRAAGDMSVQARITEVEEVRKQNEADFIAATEALEVQWEEKNIAIERSNQTVKDICKLATEGKPEELLIYAARKTGQSVNAVIKNFVNDIKRYATSFEQLSDADVDRWIDGLNVIKERQDLNEEKHEITKQKEYKEQKKVQTALEQKARQLMVDRDVPEVDFRQMVAEINKNGLDFKSEDREARVVEVLDYIHESRVLKSAEEVNPELLKDTQLLQAIYDYTSVRNVRKKSDILEIIKAFAAEETKKEQDRIAENLSRKASKNGAPPKKKSKANEEVDVDEAVMSIGGFLKKSRGV